MELLTTEQAAERLGLSPRSIRALVAAGKLAVHRLGPRGGIVRFSPEDLDEYVRRTRQYGPRSVHSPKPSHRRR